MNKKFTPGPWEIVYAPDNRMKSYPHSIRVKEWEHNNLMGDYQGCIIADLENSHGKRDHAYSEADANAKLIAAAPEMFDLLEQMVERWDRDCFHEMDFDDVRNLLTRITN